MSKPISNPFLEADYTKIMDMSKMMGEFKIPGMNIEAMMGMHRRNIEAATALSQAMFEGVQTIMRRQADLMRQGMEEAAQMANAVISSPTPEEKLVRQAEASKVAVEKCLANMRDISETVARCNYQAIETVSARMNDGLEELRDLIKNSRAA